ncbi:MAG: 16S rRNA (cytosine(1402)-N(4))-methyltransferase RsmH [Marinilabiliales bacterium]|nr:MAG: 16S rRNA (cytosine(1402)-N(4))-methyltransferase RsmH [Marinilabiliales bacterium]
MVYHKPVLLKESVDGLNIRQGGTYVDLTFGGGGHSREILSRLGKGRLISFDQDADAEEASRKITDSRFMFVRSNFRFFSNFLRYYKINMVDGILADLGVSSHHLDDPERGFSFRSGNRPDMRMNRDARVTAADILNEYNQDEIERILRDYGEVPGADRVARAIVQNREDNKYSDMESLIGVVSGFAPQRQESKYLARIFQALRIEVNNELEVLRQMLLQVLLSLNSGGRLVVISYHSLEDRMVKNFMRTGKPEGSLDKDFFGNPLVPFRLVTRKVIVAGDAEIRSNSRARSARLRIAERN